MTIAAGIANHIENNTLFCMCSRYFCKLRNACNQENNVKLDTFCYPTLNERPISNCVKCFMIWNITIRGTTNVCNIKIWWNHKLDGKYFLVGCWYFLMLMKWGLWHHCVDFGGNGMSFSTKPGCKYPASSNLVCNEGNHVSSYSPCQSLAPCMGNATNHLSEEY